MFNITINFIRIIKRLHRCIVWSSAPAFTISAPRRVTSCHSPLCLVLLNQLDIVCINVGE